MSTSPNLIVFGGPNGAGKSTFAQQFLSENAGYHFLNADEIARELRPDNLYAAKLSAGRLLFERMAGHLELGHDVALESTLAGLYLQEWLGRFRAAGYLVRLEYVFQADPEVCVARVQQRTLAGGHYVPPADVRRRHGRSLRNFWQRYRLAVDRWHLYVNESEGFREIATGVGEAAEVLDALFFNLFLRVWQS